MTQSLKVFRAQYETASHVYNSALLRVPEQRREAFHAAALKTKRGPAAKPRPARKTPAEYRSKTAAAEWKAMLLHRKRGFADLRSGARSAERLREEVLSGGACPSQRPQTSHRTIAACQRQAAPRGPPSRSCGASSAHWEMCNGCKAVRPRLSGRWTLAVWLLARCRRKAARFAEMASTGGGDSEAASKAECEADQGSAAFGD